MIILQYRRTQPSLLRWTNDSITLSSPRNAGGFPASRFWLLFTLQVYFSFPDALLPGQGYFAASFISLPALCYWMLAYYRIPKRQRRYTIIDMVLAVVTCAIKPLLSFFFSSAVPGGLYSLLFAGLMTVVWQAHVSDTDTQHSVAQL